jgi:hypothetical protein
MATKKELITLLQRRFPKKHVYSLIKHYEDMLGEYQKGNWETTILKAGKFVEAILKSIWVHSGNTLPHPRRIKIDVIIRDLLNLPIGSLNDSLRITIPRSCAFIYDIASNRGARHDPSEVNPNEIDASVVVSTCSWIISEAVRYSQGGRRNKKQILGLISGISQRKYPYIEEIDGRVYFHLPGLSARKVALLALWKKHPGRITKEGLIEIIVRHRFSEENGRKAIERLAGLIDEDRKNGYRLLQPGLSEAEELIGKKLSISRKNK